MIFTVLYCILILTLLIQFTYYFLFFSLPFNCKNNEKIKDEKSVSVIIYIKNNGKELKQNLPDLLHQEYKNFEIVLVNHSSSDETIDIIEKFQQNHKNIKVVNVENKETFWGNKKYALTLGIKGADNDYLLFFDINCKPASPYWIKQMVSKLFTNTSVVIGYKSLKKKPLSIQNIFIRFYNTISSLKMFTFAKFKTPYRAHHENFAYSKQLFFEVKGFINHLNFRGGETDLFLMDAKKIAKTQIQLSSDSFVNDQSIQKFSDFLSSFRQQFGLRSFYPIKTKILLAVFNLSKAVFWIIAIYLCFYKLPLGILSLAFYFLFQYIFLGRATLKLKETQLLYFLPILDLSYVFFIFISTILNTVSKPKL